MEVPFDVTKHEEKNLIRDIERFHELHQKYGGCINEVLEFARLYNRLVSHPNAKYTYEE